jgi:hypothetical protein
MRDVLEFAFDYLERGWPVIPALGKQPAVAWSAYQRELPSAKQVRKWFACRRQQYNLAIITGRYTGLVVVDCDSEQDTRWWQSGFPQSPLAVSTGGGGKHYYYRYPDDDVRSRSRLFGRRIDLRADGGVVIAPPSIHPETRQAYRWDDDFRHEPDDVPMFDVRWIAEPGAKGIVRRPHAFRGKTTIRNGLAYIRRIEAIAGSGGHNATFRAACKLRDSGLTAAEALQALVFWNETNASPPWSAKELAHKIDDAYRNV